MSGLRHMERRSLAPPPRRGAARGAAPGAPRAPLDEDQVFRDRLEGLDLRLSLVIPVLGIGAALATALDVLRAL